MVRGEVGGGGGGQSPRRCSLSPDAAVTLQYRSSLVRCTCYNSFPLSGTLILCLLLPFSDPSRRASIFIRYLDLPAVSSFCVELWCKWRSSILVGKLSVTAWVWTRCSDCLRYNNPFLTPTSTSTPSSFLPSFFPSLSDLAQLLTLRNPCT